LKQNVLVYSKWIGLKLLRLCTLLVALSIVTFCLMSLSPIDPVQAYIGADAMRVSPEQRQAIAEYWGLNDPPVERYLHWAAAMLRGDMGTSMLYRAPVADVIGERSLHSAALMFVAWLASGIIGLALGIIAAANKERWLDRLITWYCYTIASTPAFWMGLLMLVVFAVWLGWFPIGLAVPAGVLAADVTLLDRIYHLILPALTLAMVGIAPIALHTREKLLTVLSSDYVLYARARGEKGYTLIRQHGFRNILLPAITLQFTSFSELFGGAVLTEQVFSYPGLGQATVEAGLGGDVPLLLGIVLCSALFVFTGNLIADLLYKLIDPRMRKGGER
jgi:peptide/nickel transport system permease protein